MMAREVANFGPDASIIVTGCIFYRENFSKVAARPSMSAKKAPALNDFDVMPDCRVAIILDCF